MPRFNRDEAAIDRYLKELDAQIEKKNVGQISLHAKFFIEDLEDWVKQYPSVPFWHAWCDMLPHVRRIGDAAEKGDYDRAAESFKRMRAIWDARNKGE